MRGLTAAFIAELVAKEKSPIIFFEGEFATGTIYLWSGLGTIDWNGQTWTGAAAFAGVSNITETADIKAEGIVCSLNGISEEVRQIVLDEVQQGKPGIVYIGFLDDSGDVVADPANAFDGRLDVPSINDSGETISVNIAYETRLRDLDRPRELRYTHESQQTLHPGDLGFEYVTSLQSWSGVWGRS